MIVRIIGDLTAGLFIADIIALALGSALIKPSAAVLATFAGTLIFCRLVGQVYRHRFGLSWVNELPRSFGSLLAATLFTLTLVWVWGGAPTLEVLALACGVGFLAGALHLVAIVAARRTRRRWGLGRRTIVVGEGSVASRLATLMRTHRDFGMRPVAVMELQNHIRKEPLVRLVRRTRAEVVVLAFSRIREAQVLDEVIRATRSGVTLFVVPRLFEVHHDSWDVERLLGYPMVRYRRDPTTQPVWWVKRICDTVGAALLMVLISPVLAFGMFLVYIDTGRPIFFRQVRLGRNAKPITIYKLRSLRPVPQSQSDSTWDINRDDRVTRIGRFLRRTAMDELPQLFNILKGEMSFVGPRPERPNFAQQFTRDHARYWARHRVPAGLTGLAQVNGLRGGDGSIEDRARFDNYYIANWSLWLDCKILLQTMKEILIPACVPKVMEWVAGQPVIAHVAQPTVAGVYQVVIDVVRDQVARGWKVHVVCPESGDLLPAAIAAGARTHTWNATRQPGRSTRAEVKRLRAILENIDPDVVHLHSAKAGLAGRLALRGSRSTIFQPHAWSFEAVTGPMRAAATNWERLAARWTDVTVCVSAAEEGMGRNLGCLARRSLVAPNSVDLERFQNRDRLAARRSLGVEQEFQDAPMVVCVGRIDEQKGQDLLLLAWPQIQAAHPSVRLVIVGDGPKRAELERETPSGVDFVGFSDQVEMWLSAADVVAIPSRWEGMPLLALEAMASARPCVGFDANGIPECLGEVGIVVPRGDVQGLTAGIHQYLANPGRAHLDGVRLRRRAERHFSRPQTAEDVAAIVRSLMVVAGPVELIDLRQGCTDLEEATMPEGFERIDKEMMEK